MTHVNTNTAMTITKTPGNSEYSKSETTSRRRWIRDDVKQLVRLERAIRQCQRNASSASISPVSPCLLQKAFRFTPTSASSFSPKHSPDRQASRRSSLPQPQEAIDLTFGNRRRSFKKQRRNAFVFRPQINEHFPYGMSAIQNLDDFDASYATEDCSSSSFSMGTDHYRNNSSGGPSVVHFVHESMHLLKTDFSDLHLDDGK